MILADLHIHSRHSSDGEFAVADIISKCSEGPVAVFSLTDHNTVKGIAEADALARQARLGFIPGIEIDCNYQGTDLHLLGYHIDWQSEDFATLEREIATKVMDSLSGMIDNLRKVGFCIDTETVLSHAQDTLPTGELIAEVMLSDEKYHTPLLTPYMEGGSRSDMPYINFYLDYFAQDKPAYVPIDYMNYKDAVELIRDNGGIPIVAHPGLNLKGRERTVEKLLDLGAEGAEVFNNYHEAGQIEYFASLIERQKAIMTCGSDFHGKTKPLIHIGRFNSDPQFENYLNRSVERLKSRQSVL